MKLHQQRSLTIGLALLLSLLHVYRVASISDRFNPSQFSEYQQQLRAANLSARNYLQARSSLQELLLQRSSQFNISENKQEAYKCAKFCSCSLVGGRLSSSNQDKRRVNLTQAKCEHPQFVNLLTIDRKTQIIHISLPRPARSANDDDSDDSSSSTLTVSRGAQPSQKSSFRMPRLSQFSLLHEIIIINLKFEVCDSEVFKRGQKLRKFQLNFNDLKRLSKSCFKNLDKLQELNLDFNKLDELESALFNSLTSLKSLSIAHNKLTDLAAHQFTNLTQLVRLNLIGNSFKSINLHLFEPMQNSLRLLLLAKNEIKTFIHTPINPQLTTAANKINVTTTITIDPSSKSNLLPLPIQNSTGSFRSSNLFNGVIFKNLIKLNVDNNKFERIKSLQLHRFYNIKFLSVRKNLLSTIKDKAFNGLKLIDLNLSSNQLTSISKCAFCNSTIKHLNLAYNNITMPQMATSADNSLATSAALVGNNPADQAQPSSEPPANQAIPEASSSQNMLILSQSIFGPLFNHLEYLDLSFNEQIYEQLDVLLEPLLKLEYLNLASIGLDRSLPTPTLFKNNHKLRYLNMSQNQLDLIVSETIEPLLSLEIFDLSNNKFSELEESFLVTLDELTSLKIINFAVNPWFCSQCKVAPLYDWILRSSIYNATCISSSSSSATNDNGALGDETTDGNTNMDELELDAKSGLSYRPNFDDDKAVGESGITLVDSLGSLGESNLDNINGLFSSADADDSIGYFKDSYGSIAVQDEDDDTSIAQTIAIVLKMQQQQLQQIKFNPANYCMKCEFPGELRAYNIHELSPNDFKFCPSSSTRMSASEPKIGLTLAIVIIGALFCIIIIVIIMYRKKSQTYYPQEDTDQLNASGGTGKGGKRVFSISSDVDNHDATDYSSPPMSNDQDSYETYSQEDEDEEVEEEDEELDDEEIIDEEEEEEELAEEEEELDDDEQSNLSHSTGKRMIDAELERKQQLAEYNKNEIKIQQMSKALKSSQSIKSIKSASPPMIGQPEAGNDPNPVPSASKAATSRQDSNRANKRGTRQSSLQSPSVNKQSALSTNVETSPLGGNTQQQQSPTVIGFRQTSRQSSEQRQAQEPLSAHTLVHMANFVAAAKTDSKDLDLVRSDNNVTSVNLNGAINSKLVQTPSTEDSSRLIRHNVLRNLSTRNGTPPVNNEPLNESPMDQIPASRQQKQHLRQQSSLQSAHSSVHSASSNKFKSAKTIDSGRPQSSTAAMDQLASKSGSALARPQLGRQRFATSKDPPGQPPVTPAAQKPLWPPESAQESRIQLDEEEEEEEVDDLDELMAAAELEVERQSNLESFRRSGAGGPSISADATTADSLSLEEDFGGQQGLLAPQGGALEMLPSSPEVPTTSQPDSGAIQARGRLREPPTSQSALTQTGSSREAFD